MPNSLGGRLRDALTSPDPVIPATAVALALPAAYVVGTATQEPTAPFFVLLLVGVRVPWLAAPDVRSSADTADASDTIDHDGSVTESDDGSPASTPRAVLWTASTSVVVAAALLGLYAAGVAFDFPTNAASAVAFFVSWVLAEPVVVGLD